MFARTRGHPGWAERAISAFSRTGEHGACWLALGLGGTILTDSPHRRRAWLRGVRIVSGAYALNYAVKVAVRRPRPELPGLAPLTPTVSRLSFPSAHATTSFAAARAFAPLVPAGALYTVAVAFALTRPYLGVHYPSDVIAGAVLGTMIAQSWPDTGRSQPPGQAQPLPGRSQPPPGRSQPPAGRSQPPAGRSQPPPGARE